MSDIHSDCERVVEQASSGQKAWLTQMKNHYTKVVQDDPEGAALLLAMYEHQFGTLKR